MRKKLVLFFMLCFLMILVIGTMAVYANAVAVLPCFGSGVTTDGKYIYAAEGDCICKYDMNENNREVIYKGLPYAIDIVAMNDKYLYFNEATTLDGRYGEGVHFNWDFKVLNLEDYSSVLIKSDMLADSINFIGNKIFFEYSRHEGGGWSNWYSCDIDGKNLNLVTEYLWDSRYIKELNGYLYYSEKKGYNEPVRLIKANLDGSNPIVILDNLTKLNFGSICEINEDNVIYEVYDHEDNYYQQDYSTGKVKKLDNYNYGYREFFCNDGVNKYYIYYINGISKIYLSLPSGEKKEIKTFDDLNLKMSFLNIIDGVLYYRDNGSYYYYDDDAQSWYQSNPLDVKSVRIYEPEITASPTTASLIVNSEYVTPVAYNINGSNYFKLRDLAYILDGTGSQFDVGWDSDQKLITINTGVNYNAVGGEMTSSADSQNVSASNVEISVNGQSISLTAYNIGGNNYFMLRDLGEYLGFDVDWDSASSSIIVNTI